GSTPPPSHLGLKSDGLLASKLHRAGYTQVCVAAQQVRGLHLFYVGPYRNAASARDAKAPLHKLTGVEGILRKLG
ncbi:MAG TPA: SPOR domain-containing protein, partial [Thiomonas arsenitoxydans]|nr:SPOR domain-containing protein [Thiomonas arsenitoxydans]